MSILRGDLYYADLSPVIGCEQGGIRPILILQNDVGNRYSPTVIVAAVTSRRGKMDFPTHVLLDGESCGLKAHSVILLEQIRTIDRSRLKEYIGHLEAEHMKAVDRALSVSLGFVPPQTAVSQVIDG